METFPGLRSLLPVYVRETLDFGSLGNGEVYIDERTHEY